MVHQPGGCLHAVRELLVKRESPGAWVESLSLSPTAPWELPWNKSISVTLLLGKGPAGALEEAKLLPSEWKLDALDEALLALWRIMKDTQSGTTAQKTETIQGSPDTTGLGIYNNVIAPPSPKTCQAGDSLRPAASWWWAAANCYAPFKCTPACSAGKLPILSSHKQSRFGRIKGGGAACESF